MNNSTTATLSDQLKQRAFNYIEDDPFVSKLIDEGVLLSRPETAKLLKVSVDCFSVHFRKKLKGFYFRRYNTTGRKEFVYFLRSDIEKLPRFSKVYSPQLF